MTGRERPIPEMKKRSGAARSPAATGAARLRPSARPAPWAWLLAVRAASGAAAGARATARLIGRRPRAAGAAGVVLLAATALAYGAYRGDRTTFSAASFADLRDRAANAAGFKIATLTITGRNQLSEAEILSTAGITANTSLLFLDVAAVRERLQATPWVAHATVRKLYPDHLEIALEERRAFALWQKDGKLSFIASDGTVLAPVEAHNVPRLPLVVGPGAAAKAQEFLALIERYPLLRDEMRAAILVADRRWNLKLKSGLDIRLPETGVDKALETLVALDGEKKILTRDLTAIDMRLPERLTVRLSDEAAQAREKALKDNKKKRKGGDA